MWRGTPLSTLRTLPQENFFCFPEPLSRWGVGGMLAHGSLRELRISF